MSIHRTIGVGSLARAALAALAVAYCAIAPHAQAQRRPIDGRAAVQATAPSGDAVAVEGVVNIQTASAEELQRLPGIGPSKAAAIIAYRERTPFRRIEDVMRVRGIGRATFRRLRPMLTVSGPTTLSTDVRAVRSRVAADADDEADAQP